MSTSSYQSPLIHHFSLQQVLRTKAKSANMSVKDYNQLPSTLRRTVAGQGQFVYQDGCWRVVEFTDKS